jgi:hypothetical protein
MDILIRILEERFGNKKIEIVEEGIKKEECDKDTINKTKLIKLFLIINIIVLILAFISNGCILYVKKILSIQEDFYGIKNIDNVKMCFMVSSVLFLLLVVLLTFLYPFYNYFKECEKMELDNKEKK